MNKKGSAIGLYFPLSKGAANDLRRRLNYQFGQMGYADKDSKPPWRGGLPAGLLAIDKGELALVLLPDEQRTWAREWLYQRADDLTNDTETGCTPKELAIAEALRTIADALGEAMNKEIEAEAEEEPA